MTPLVCAFAVGMAVGMSGLASPSEAEGWALLKGDLPSKAEQAGAFVPLSAPQDGLSGALRITDRQAIEADDFHEALDHLRPCLECSGLRFWSDDEFWRCWVSGPLATRE